MEYRNPAIQPGMDAMMARAAEAAADPTRPVYHFVPPSGWMNDVNGPPPPSGLLPRLLSTQPVPHGCKVRHALGAYPQYRPCPLGALAPCALAVHGVGRDELLLRDGRIQQGRPADHPVHLHKEMGTGQSGARAVPAVGRHRRRRPHQLDEVPRPTRPSASKKTVARSSTGGGAIPSSSTSRAGASWFLEQPALEPRYGSPSRAISSTGHIAGSPPTSARNAPTSSSWATTG